VKIGILGREYVVRAPARPEYMEQVAARADGLMREIARRDPRLSPLQVAVLAVLNTTDELLRATDRLQREMERNQRRGGPGARAHLRVARGGGAVPGPVPDDGRATGDDKG